MLLVAIEDRKARMEVGYGLEPILPDALAGRILEQQLFPAFKEQRYAAGLTAAVERIVQIIEKNGPAPAHLRQQGGPIDPLVVVAILSVFVAIGAFGWRGIRPRRLACGPVWLALYRDSTLYRVVRRVPLGAAGPYSARPPLGVGRLPGRTKPRPGAEIGLALGLELGRPQH